MAPSRALLLLRCSAQAAQRRATPHLLSTTGRLRPQPISAWSTPHSRPAIRQTHPSPPLSSPMRLYSQDSSSNSTSAPTPPDYLNEKELAIFNKIVAELEPVKLEVQDISGGCGSMYALSIESPRFKGLSVIKQHKLVNAVLAEDIAGWHGVQLRTKAA